MIGVDSTFIIDLLKSGGSAETFEPYAEEDLSTSEIVVYEVLQGIYGSRYFNETLLRTFEALLDTFTFVFPIDRKASRLAAKISAELQHAGKSIPHSDVLIAGCFLANGCLSILTKNKKDFERIEGLRVLGY